MIKYDPNLKVYYSDKINNLGLFLAFGTRDLGDGRDIKNIKNFLTKNNVQYKNIIIPDQIHSNHIEVIDNVKEEVVKIYKTDGLITGKPGVVMTVITADCIPAVFVDKKSRKIGIAHLGKSGSMKKLNSKMIDKLLSLGSSTKDIVVVLGPGIGKCCYEINLLELNFNQLLEAGIPRENIDFFPFCTKCFNKRFYSLRHMRRDDFPRQFSLIVKST